MRAHRTPARHPYMAGGAARRAWPEESGRGVDRDGVLTAGRTAGLREGGPGLPLEERLLRSFPRSVSAPRQFGVALSRTRKRGTLSLYLVPNPPGAGGFFAAVVSNRKAA